VVANPSATTGASELLVGGRRRRPVPPYEVPERIEFGAQGAWAWPP